MIILFSIMSTYSAKLELFWKKLGECPYELPDEIKPYVEGAIKAAGFDQVVTVQGGGGSSPAATGTAPKRLSGYNVFMREKSAEFKAQNVPSGERMSKVGALWKTMSDSEKAEFKTKATNITAAASPIGSPPAKAAKAPKKGSGQLTGYQLYMKEKMAELKSQNVPGGERMGKVAGMWKLLSDPEKKEWAAKAKTTSPSAATPAV